MATKKAAKIANKKTYIERMHMKVHLKMPHKWTT